jgi:hypothetical protein
VRAASGRRGILPASLDPDRVEISFEENARSWFRPAHRMRRVDGENLADIAFSRT